jgi:DNA-binding NarL/FixJ family response regulator
VRLVLADNDQSALDLIDLDLRLEGHDVVALAHDGAEAVAACAAHRPDVLVVDYRMPPGSNGVEVATQVLAANTADRVIVYSNYTDPYVIACAEAVGATWLAKGRLDALRTALG